MRLSLPKLAAIGLLLLLATPSYAGLREDGAACDAKDSHPDADDPRLHPADRDQSQGRDLAITYYLTARSPGTNKGDLEKAKSDYDQSIAINPSFAPSYGQRAKVYLQTRGPRPRAERLRSGDSAEAGRSVQRRLVQQSRRGVRRNRRL